MVFGCAFLQQRDIGRMSGAGSSVRALNDKAAMRNVEPFLIKLSRPRAVKMLNFIILSWEIYGRGESLGQLNICLLYTSPSPRDLSTSRMPSSA